MFLPGTALPAGLALTAWSGTRSLTSLRRGTKGLSIHPLSPPLPAHVDHTWPSHASSCPALGERQVVCGGDEPSILGLMAPRETGGPAPCTSHVPWKALVEPAQGGIGLSVLSSQIRWFSANERNPFGGDTGPWVLLAAQGARAHLRLHCGAQMAFFTDRHWGHAQQWLGPGAC